MEKTDGCWNWKGTLFRNGYGAFGVSGKTCGAHRVAYELAIGPIPAGLQLDHLCRNRGCVNPGHLEPVTGTVNTGRGAAARSTRYAPKMPTLTQDYLDLIGALVQARTQAKMSQRQLARYLKQPASYIGKIERGERRIDPVECAAWAKGCGMAPMALFVLFSQRLEIR